MENNMTVKELPFRKDVPIEETWGLESIFPDSKAWEKSSHELMEKLPGAFEDFVGTLDQAPERLLECLTLREEFLRIAEKLYIYAGLESRADVTNQEATARAGQGQGLLNQVLAAVSFIEPEIIAIGEDKLREWVKSFPELAIYKHYFENLSRQQKHLCSPEVEKILAMSADPTEYIFTTYRSLVNADLDFKPAVAQDGSTSEVNQSSIGALITDPDREIRRTAWENYADVYLTFQNTIGTTQVGVIKKDIYLARARNHSSSLEASLFPHNIPEEVFHNLIQVFKENLPTWHRYWRVRKEILGFDKLHVYDIKAPLSKNKPQISYQQAVDWICEGMAPLGEEYVSIMRGGCLENRWVDRVRNKGKTQGAFSWGMYDTQPFILMSYADTVFSLSTLAHELGHSMHSYLTWKNQPHIYSLYSLFAAEVASNFNQALVRDYIFNNLDDLEIQLALIEEAMSNYHRYFFIMPTLARFELEMHQRVERGEPVNARTMIDYTASLFQEGYGDEVEFDHDRIGISWAQFSHMYRNFYVYQYATGISGADALVKRVLTEGDSAAEDYLGFLKAGGSQYPLDALQKAGVDLTSPAPVKSAFQVLADTVDRLEQLDL
jgi:oligoendopeptidase F